MALVDSGGAIGAVTRLLEEHLTRRGFSVTVGKPEDAVQPGAQAAKLNLFLFETSLDANLRNVPLTDGDPPPLWLRLRYLLTAFDTDDVSDSADAHELLGRGAAALHDLHVLHLDDAVDAGIRVALEHNPEPLKLTLESTPIDLLSKVMGGAEERFRVSAAFEVRPVMIVASPPQRVPRRVGIDYTGDPLPSVHGDGVGLTVLPTMGPRLSDVRPTFGAPGDEVVLRGEELHLGGLEATLGGVPVRLVGQRVGEARVELEGPVAPPATEGPVAAGSTLSAGEHPLRLRLPTAPGRFRTSNPVLVRLLPRVDGATLAADGTLEVTGTLLGGWEDDVVVGLEREGSLARLLEMGLAPPPPPAPGTVVPHDGQRRLTVGDAAAGLAPGAYRVVVRVNGQEALARPAVAVEAP